jgi:hypothetical protein
MSKRKTTMVEGVECYEGTQRPIWMHRFSIVAERDAGKRVPLSENGIVLRMLDSIQELEEQSRPGEDDNAPGKDMAAFNALTAAAVLVKQIAGWALDHQRGLAEKGLKFVPNAPTQGKRSPAYLESKAAVDTHEHERLGSLRNELSIAQQRRFVINILGAMDFGLGLPNDFVEALEALEFGETLPLVEPIHTRKRTGLTAYRAKLTAIAFVEYQSKKGVKKHQSMDEVAREFGQSADAVKDWPVDLREVLGNSEVERILTEARGSGAQYLEERRNLSDGPDWCEYFEGHYGRPAMLRAAARFKARSKKGRKSSKVR